MSNHDREDKTPVIFAHRASKDPSKIQGEKYDKLGEKQQSLWTEAYKDNFRAVRSDTRMDIPCPSAYVISNICQRYRKSHNDSVCLTYYIPVNMLLYMCVYTHIYK